MKKFRNIAIITIIAATIMQVICIFNNNIWYDESYTMGLINHNMFDLIKIAISDVHPLLYYILLKIFTYVFGSSVIVLKLFSVIPIVILAVFGYRSLSKEFGNKIGMLFVLLLELFPITLVYAVQIRMYSYTMLFVFVTLFYMYKALKYNKNKYFVIFAIFSAVSSYTHHFAFFACLILDLVMLIYMITKNKLLIKKYIIAIIGQLILFLPGLIIFLIQAFNVSLGYWIEIKYPQIFLEIIEFCFKGNINSVIPVIFGSIFLIYIAVKIITYKDKKDIIYKISLISFGIVALLIIGSLLISLYRPIFIPRYILPVFAVLIFGITCILSLEKNKYIIIALFIGLFSLNIWNYTIYINKCYDMQNEEIKKLVDVRENDIFVYSDVRTSGIIATYYKDNIQFFYNKNKFNISEAYKAFDPQMIVIENIDEIKKYDRIWVVDCDLSNMYEDLKKEVNMNELITKKEIFNPYSGSLFVVSLFEKTE